MGTNITHDGQAALYRDREWRGAQKNVENTYVYCSLNVDH